MIRHDLVAQTVKFENLIWFTLTSIISDYSTIVRWDNMNIKISLVPETISYLK